MWARKPEGGAGRAGGWRRFARRVLTVLFLVLVGFAIAMALRGQDWSVLAVATRERHPGYFALMVGVAFLANAVALLLAMVAWRAMLSGLGGRVGAVAAARIFLVCQFVKFVPGKVLGLAVSIQMGRAIGVTATRMMSAYLLTVVVILVTGGTVGLAAAPDVIGGSAAWLALAVIPTVAVLVRPELVDRAAVAAARLLRRSPPMASGSGRGVRRAVVAQTLAWLLGGVQLWFLAVAMGAPPAHSLLLCVGAFGLATVAGMLVVIAPEGVGVREVVLLAALGTALPLPVASVVVLVSRLVTMLSELTAAAVGLLVTEALRRSRRERPQPVLAGLPGDGSV